jgi:alpha-tubulin suppressor-like RCC1 family protein
LLNKASCNVSCHPLLLTLPWHFLVHHFTLFTQVAAGGTHSLAVTSSGRMFIWGRASYGRLGAGCSAKDQYSPVEVALPGGHERWKVAAATAGAAVCLLNLCLNGATNRIFCLER